MATTDAPQKTVMLLVATVQHSGTRRLLEFLGWDFVPLHERHKAGPRTALVAHLFDVRMPDILAFDGPIITTRRPESDIRASWAKRERDPLQLDEQLRNYARLLEIEPYIVDLGRCH